MWKRTTGNGPNSPANDERYFVYDESGHLSGEYDANGILIQETVWLDDTPVAMLRKPANATTAASIANSAVVYRIWSDHLDTPRTIAAIDANNNAANQAAWSGDSDAFGNTLPATTSGNLNVSTLEYNLRFPGQYFDIETSLHYNYYRDYNASAGRYTQADPLGLLDDWSLYAYVAASPASFVDPFGLAKVKPKPKRGSREVKTCADLGKLARGRARSKRDGAFENANNTCEYCEKNKDTQVDHYIPVRECFDQIVAGRKTKAECLELLNKIDNLIAACQPCNRDKSDSLPDGKYKLPDKRGRF